MSPALNSKIISLDEVPFDDVQVDGRGTRPLVMVVDDEVLVADTLSLILSKAGFATRTAYDGAMAMEMAEEFAPRLLITDIAMPGMTGLEVAHSMLAKCPECRVLFFSGHVTSLQLVEMLGDDHPYELLTKPVHPTEMLKHVSRLLQPASFAAELETLPGVQRGTGILQTIAA